MALLHANERARARRLPLGSILAAYRAGLEKIHLTVFGVDPVRKQVYGKRRQKVLLNVA